jgi:hypothetical protein
VLSAGHSWTRTESKRGGVIGEVEAARTAMGVLRHLYSWALNEGKLKRSDNPASRIDKKLQRKKARDVVLTLNEARIVWQAAQEIGYPFGWSASGRTSSTTDQSTERNAGISRSKPVTFT